MSKYIVYTDGGARGNPGPAGAGAVICDVSGEIKKELHQSLGRATNNFAEYSAVILGLEGLKKLVPKSERKRVQVEVRMDSELVQQQLSNKYEIREETLFPLFIKVHNLMVSHFPRVSFKHIRRSENEHADRLSNLAMNESESSLGH